MADDLRAVQSRFPPFQAHHPVNMKDIRAQWDQGCSKILASSSLSNDEKIIAVMGWLNKGSIKDYVLGKLILSFAKPKRSPLTDEQKKAKRQKALLKGIYHDDIPHLRAVNKVVATRLEEPALQEMDTGSLATVDAVDDREKETPGAMFAEFEKSIECQLEIEYKSRVKVGDIFDAAE